MFYVNSSHWYLDYSLPSMAQPPPRTVTSRSLFVPRERRFAPPFPGIALRHRSRVIPTDLVAMMQSIKPQYFD